MLIAALAWGGASEAGHRGGPDCDTRADVLALLAQKYKEAPIAFGVTNNGGLVEVLTDEHGTTWTIIVTSPEGVTCLVAAGEGWRDITPEEST